MNLKTLFPNASESFLHLHGLAPAPKMEGMKECLSCGQPFMPKKHSKGPSYQQNFCRQKCAASFTGKRTMILNQAHNPRTKMVTKICEKCGKPFERWAANIAATESRGKRSVFCSTECSREHVTTKGNLTRHKMGFYKSQRLYTRGTKGWVELGDQRFFARSSWEANYGRYLEWLKTNGQIKSWRHEPTTFWFPGIKRGVLSYLPDFEVTADGIEYHEVKGWMDAKSKTKIRRMAKYHPHIVLKVIDGPRYKALAKSLSSVVPGWTK